MRGTNLQRSVRLAKDLILHPTNLSRYFTASITKKANPLTLGLPWISFAAIDFLEKYLKPNHIVAEFGGGGSTIFFARKTRRVLSIESNKYWAEKLEGRLWNLELINVVLKVCPYDPNNKEEFINSDFLKSIQGNYYNLILVDCLDPTATLRPECFKFSENYIKKGGCIVVDDSWRYPSIRENNYAIHWKEFRSIGPCRTGVTTTDIYFY
jgi:hypothetical protein